MSVVDAGVVHALEADLDNPCPRSTLGDRVVELLAPRVVTVLLDITMVGLTVIGKHSGIENI